MNYLVFFLMNVSLACAAHTPYSLFLTQQEQQEYIVTNQQVKNQRPENSVCLDALMYFDESNWSFWLNGQQITPTQIPEHLQIEHVCEDSVELTWIKEDKAIPLILQVNQIIDLG